MGAVSPSLLAGVSTLDLIQQKHEGLVNEVTGSLKILRKRESENCFGTAVRHPARDFEQNEISVC